jgi:hypothetical protein
MNTLKIKQSPRKKLTRSSSTQDLFASTTTQTSETSPLNSPKGKDKEPQIKLKITKDMLPEKTKVLYKDVELHTGGIHKFELTNGHKIFKNNKKISVLIFSFELCRCSI